MAGGAALAAQPSVRRRLRKRSDDVKSRKRRPIHSASSGILRPRLGKLRRPARTQHVGFAWYRSEQWGRLRELAADVANLEDNYDAWLSAAERTEADLRALGILVERVPVDVEVIAAWCTRQSRPFDSAARAEYVADAMRKRGSES